MQSPQNEVNVETLSNTIPSDVQGSDNDSESYLSDNDTSSFSPELHGNLQKWTNYFHGWQERYFVLKDGCLSYFKDQSDVSVGSRGSICLDKASIKEHQFDELRFDVAVNDSIWHCRAKTEDERKLWLDTLELSKSSDSGFGSRSVHGSIFSLTSLNSMNHFGGKRNKKLPEVQNLLNELESLRGVAIQQLDELMKHFDDSLITAQGDLSSPVSDDIALLRAEALNFKGVADEMIELWQQCLDNFATQNEQLKTRQEKQTKRRKRVEIHPESPVLETIIQEPIFDEPDISPNFDTPRIEHRLSEQCDKYVTENLSYAFSGSGDNDDGWELLHSEGEMKVFRKEVEIDGVVMDPLKATHQVDGITAQEICQWFFNPDAKMEWEGHLLDQVNVCEVLDSDTIIIQSIMKRVWPSAQRDMLFVSHIRNVCPMDIEKDQNDTWIVCNFSTELPEVPVKRGVVRCIMRASLVCQTVLKNPKANHVTRDDISCKIWYTADVNPGGWAPAKVLRQIYKHEYPKFLRKFGGYVYSKVKDNEVYISSSLSNKSNR